jgi:type IV secretory pathway protease TraF
MERKASMDFRYISKFNMSQSWCVGIWYFDTHPPLTAYRFIILNIPAFFYTLGNNGRAALYADRLTINIA